MPIRKSRVSGIVASGTTADRPTSPSIGDTFFNGTLGVQEIYTSTGWLPATGANDFNIVLTGSETSVTLDKEYFVGAYTISSALSDTTFDVYLFDTSNNVVGYSSSPSINATGNFNKIMVYGGTNGDLLSFSYKTTFTTSATTTDTFAAPYVTSISVADLPNIDDSTTITGGNFDTDIEVWFDGQNNYSSQAKSVVYGSSTSIVATRPDDLLEDNAPYTVRVINPGTISPSGSNKNKLVDSITAGGDPTWVTPSGALTSVAIGEAYSTTVEATDPDGGMITYSVVTGSLPPGLSLNSSTGVISGTPADRSQTFTIAAIDTGGNVTNRSFSIDVSIATGGTVTESEGYRYHTFTSNGTFTLAAPLTVEALIVAGGGGGGSRYGGGGGGGGYRASTVSLSAQTYGVTIGGGGAGGTMNGTNSASRGSNGSNSSAFGITSTGGGGGGSADVDQSGASGGSGGGGGIDVGASGTPGQGNAGGQGYGNTGSYPYKCGGGGGASAAGQNGDVNAGYGGDGGAGSTWLNGTQYSGGGGGGSHDPYTGKSFSAGGAGGGGRSGLYGQKNAGIAGSTNTGGGGGGAATNTSGDSSTVGGAGGSGIVIVRYPI